MGIQNLLPFLENATRPTHISEFRGKTAAVDSFCWLHRGAIGCALELAKGEKTDTYVKYCVKMIKMLQHFDIRPIMVFDGRRLPAKQQTEEKRQKDRAKSKKLGMDLLRLGHTNQATHYFRLSINITAEMVLSLIKVCREMNIDYIVAPYEADAQLAFLNINELADFVISEDSDLMVFGCRQVFYKMDVTGLGNLTESSKISECMKIRAERYSFSKFRHMCILSGCDYISSLPGIGLKKALNFISMTDETDPAKFLDKMPQYLKKSSLVITDEYKENFLLADATFQFQIVYNPILRKLQTLNPVTVEMKYLKNAGTVFDPAEAFELAIGNLDAKTMKRMDNWKLPEKLDRYSIWSDSFSRSPQKVKHTKINNPFAMRSKSLDLQVQEKAKTESDLAFEKEVGLYKKSLSETIDSKAEEIEEEEVMDTPQSPVIVTKNPFIKKKISKWASTKSSNDTSLMKSRFFSNSSSDNDSHNSSTSMIEVEINQNHLFPEIQLETPNGEVITESETPNQEVTTDDQNKDSSDKTLKSVENKMDVKPVKEPDLKKRKVTIIVNKKKQITITDMLSRMKSK